MKIAALAGGVGAARVLSGLIEIIHPEELTIIVNTGDDFKWMGLYICPDLDTISYTLAGIANPETGWGLRDDTFRLLDRLSQLGCDTWFKLGDCDLATHIYRTHHLGEGFGLTAITRKICDALQIRAPILPMTDGSVPTIVRTDEGDLPFQEYFVRRKCTPRVTGFTFTAIEQAQPAPGVLESLQAANAILICPSNPFISIAPILAVPGIRDALRSSSARVVAVTPIIAGQAVKGPAARMLEQMGEEVSAVSVARMYQDFLDEFVLDCRDHELSPRIASLGMDVRLAATLMETREQKVQLARTIYESLI